MTLSVCKGGCRLAQTVDRWACIFLLVAYVTTTVVVLAV